MRPLQNNGLGVLCCLWGIGIGLWFLSFKSYGLEKLKILTSIAPLYCFCVNIGGEYVTVKNLIFFGAEPHEVSLSMRQMQEIQDSDLIVINGLGMESWLEKGLSSKEKAKKIVVSTVGIEPIPSIGSLNKLPANSPYSFNPHVWLDPNLAIQQVLNIKKALCQRDPLHTEAYEKNAASYIFKLKEIDRMYREKLQEIAQKKAYFFNDSFMYLTKRYDILVAGILEECGQREGLSPRKLATAIETMRKEKIPFFYTPFSKKALVMEIIKESQTCSGEIDSMESANPDPSLYETIAKKNLSVLVEVFGKKNLCWSHNFEVCADGKEQN